MSSFHLEPLCGVQCSTTGTGNYACGTALPGMCTFALVYADSDTFTYCARDTAGNFEEGLGSYVAASNQIVRVSVYTAGTPTSRTTGTPANWSSGVRNLFIDFPSTHGGLMVGALNGSEFTSPATVRTTLGITFGVAAGNVPQMDGSGRYPAADGSQITGLPAASCPSGMVIPCYMAAAPTGWTKLVSISDKLLSLVIDGTGGTNDTGLGGFDVTWGLTVSGHALTAAELPLFTNGTPTGGGSPPYTVSPQTAAAHSHAITSASTWRPPRAYCILISKN